MATARARGIPADENALQPLRGVKAGDAAANAAPKRRALGDIGNVVQTFNDHCQVSKGVPKKEAPAQAQKPQEEKQQAHLSEKQSTEPGNENPAGRRTLRASTLAQRDRYHVSATRSMGRRSMSSSLQTNSDEALRLSTKPSRRSAARSSAPHSPLPDIDSRDRRDPLQLTDYVQDLQDYWKRIEAIPKFKVDPEYMTIQRDINAKMRSILVSWLVEVHYKFKLAPETLFLTVNIIDRFLSRRSITRNYLQLIGCCGMLIASKYEEVFAPEVNDFVFISDNAYTKEEVLKMERIMLSVLKYEMCVPTVFHFIARYLKAVGIKGRLQPQDGKMVYDDQQDAYVAFTAHYFAELSLIHYSFLQWKPSEIAAACVYAAMRTMNRSVPFPYALQKHSGYSEEHVKHSAETLVAEHQREPSRAQTVNAVWRKYQSSKFLKVSVSVPLCEALLPAASGAKA